MGYMFTLMLILVIAQIQQSNAGDERPHPCGEPVYPIGPPITPRPNQGTHILNGDLANPHSWPWMAYLNIRGGPCAGILVPVCHDVSASDIALTAAHCIWSWDYKAKKDNRYPGTGSAMFGGHNIYANEHYRQWRRIDVEPVLHPAWKPQPNISVFGWDLAVIKLRTPVNFTREVRPICLANNTQLQEVPQAGWTCFISGWGATEPNGDASDILRQASVYKRYTYEECVRFMAACCPLWPTKDVRREFKGGICSEPILVPPRKFAAPGDSGGPFMCRRANSDRWILIGVIHAGQHNERNETILNLAAQVSWGNNLKWVKAMISRMSTIPVNGKCSHEIYEN